MRLRNHRPSASTQVLATLAQVWRQVAGRGYVRLSRRSPWPALCSTCARVARPTLIVIAACALLAVASLPSQTQAAPAGPPRPTPRPKPTPCDASLGATIELRVQFGPTWPGAGIPWQELWTVVQWQDGLGEWHDVEGWQGTLDRIVDREGRKVWWLNWDLLGAGPFRWVVHRAQAGEPMATSEPFYLPEGIGQIVAVEVSLEPSPAELPADPR